MQFLMVGSGIQIRIWIRIWIWIRIKTGSTSASLLTGLQQEIILLFLLLKLYKKSAKIGKKNLKKDLDPGTCTYKKRVTVRAEEMVVKKYFG